MGASIEVDDRKAIVTGVEQLVGAEVEATDFTLWCGSCVRRLSCFWGDQSGAIDSY